ncbi:MAG: helix-turn-helix domain-containing protein [Bacteroidota bacterium]
MKNHTNTDKEGVTFDKKSIAPAECPVTYCMSKIGGKWKPILLYLIEKGANRFGILQRGIKGISKQMLTKQLRELEQDGILSREIFAEIPPRVEYSLTETGRSLLPVIGAMRAWGEANLPEQRS